jgi:hypothetical protein
VRRFLLALLALVIGTVVALVLVTSDTRVQHWLGAKATALAHELTGLPLQIAWIHWDVLGNSLLIGDAALVATDSEPWVELPLVAVEFGWTGISLSRVRLQSVTLHQPRIHVHIDADMRVEPVESILDILAAAPVTDTEEQSGAPLFRLDIDEVHLAHADLRFSMADPPMEARFRDSEIATEIVGNLPGRLRFTFDQGTYRLYEWPYDGLRLSGEGRFADPGLLLENVQLHGEVPSVDFAVDGRIAFDEEPVMLLDVGGLADAGVVNLHYTSIPELIGTVTLRQELRVHSETGFSMAGWVAAESLLVQGRLVRDVQGELSMDEMGMDIGPFGLRADGGQLRTSGRIGWDPVLDLVFRPEIDGLDLAWLEAFFGPMPLSPEGTLQVKGQLRVIDEPALLVSVAVTGTSELRRIELVPGRSLPPQAVSVAVALEIDEETVGFSRLAVRAPSFSTVLSGAVPMGDGIAAFAGSASVSDLDVLSSTVGFAIGGQGEGRFALDGDRFDVTASGSNVAAFGTEWDFADLSLIVEGDTLQIPVLDLASGTERVRLAMQSSDDGWRAEADTSGLSLSALRSDMPLGGQLVGRVVAESATGQVVPSLVASLELREFRHEGWRLGNWQLSANTMNGRLRADLRAEGEVQGALAVEGRTDRNAAALSGTLSWTLPTELSDMLGTSGLLFDGQALVAGPTGHGHVRIRAADPADDLLAILQADETSARLLIRRSAGPLHGRLAGEWSVAGPWTLLGRVRAANVLRGIEGLAGHSAAADLDLAGHGGDLARLIGHARVQELSAVVGGVTLTQQDELVVESADQRWVLASPLRLRVAERGELSITGSMRPEAGWNLVVQGPLPLDLLLPLGIGLRSIEGQAAASATISGPWLQPDMRGELTLTGARAELQGIDAPFEMLEGTARMDGDSLIIDRLKGVWGDGSAEMRGRIGLVGPRLGDIDLRVAVATERVQIERRLLSGVQGQLDLTALPGRTLAIGGDLELLAASYDEEIAWERAILQLRSGVVDPEFLDDGTSPRLDVRIRGRRDLQVRTNLLQGGVELDTQVRGTLQTPRLYGLAELRPGGLFFFRGQVYVLRRGLVQFVDPSGRIPFLDVEAETTVWHDRRRQEYRVILTILGPIDRLQIRFQSEPPLDEVEILTLLSFGVLPEELAGEESDAQGTAGRELSTIILSGQISRIEQEIQSIIGFDRLEIEPAFSSPRSSSSMQVTLQKRLTERLRLSLSSGLEVGGEQRVELGYRLLEGLDVSLGWNSRIDDPAGSFFTRPRIVIPLP